MRKCLQCRQDFEPSTQFMFRCDPCKDTEKRADEYYIYGYIGESHQRITHDPIPPESVRRAVPATAS